MCYSCERLGQYNKTYRWFICFSMEKEEGKDINATGSLLVYETGVDSSIY
jgi:hypothetical protein